MIEITMLSPEPYVRGDVFTEREASEYARRGEKPSD
jgi:hypothetical protein